MKNRIINFVTKYREISLFIAISILGFGSLATKGCATSTDASPAREAQESFDTFIPSGYSLVPIEVSNYETLDSLLGSFGVVDLFTTPLNPQDKAQRIAYRVKILRAPKNPSHFAVLVPFDDVKKIMRFSGPFLVSVQNPKAVGTGFEKERSQKRSRILYNTGE